MEIATFAGGCFWCTEAVFKRLKGVNKVTSGYAGGQQKDPTYDQVHAGGTGYAESIQIKFDPKQISYETLLTIFFATHDPTTLNRDGANIGPEYRSVIFYHNEKQQEEAMHMIEKLKQTKTYDDPIVTEIIPFTTFYPAEAEHKDFYEKNKSAPYCRLVIDPKIQKLLQKFSNEIKDEYK